MKNSIKQSLLLLTGIATCGMFFLAASPQQPAVEKPQGKPWPVPKKVMTLTSPIQPQEGILETGKDIWSQQCKSCHGKKGKGDGVKAEKLDISCGDFTSKKIQEATDAELFWKMSEGRKPMPSFKGELSDIERWAVVLYTRTLAEDDQ